MIRKIIKIDKETCNGCGLCVNACHEGAIGLVDGKAQLLRDDYCDGLGNCLPVCPVNAITFVEREALEYNEEEVKKNMEKQKKEINQGVSSFTGCPGAQSRTIVRKTPAQPVHANDTVPQSMLNQWPIQIQLVPVNAPYFDGANLLIAADCTAYAYGNFHNEFIKGRITLIGCPKLDEVDYSDKLTEIIRNNNIKSITIVRMIVPCCGGIVNAVKTALINSGKMIPWQVVTISTDGTKVDM
ncbi:MAG: Anaerobic sulfite reductase subunit C [Lachnoclostridium sp.]|jgi:ferredoxin